MGFFFHCRLETAYSELGPVVRRWVLHTGPWQVFWTAVKDAWRKHTGIVGTKARCGMNRAVTVGEVKMTVTHSLLC